MTMNTTPIIFHVPGLQPQLACSGLPQCVRFVSPGLPGAAGERFFVSPELVFSPAEARAYLNEMLSLGEGYRNTRDLVTLALQPDENPYSGDRALRSEMAELQRFAETGVLEGFDDEDIFPSESAGGIGSGSQGASGGAAGYANSADSGGSAGQGKKRIAAPAPRDSAAAAQKALILAWSLEARVHELRQLKNRFAGAAASLRATIGAEDADEEFSQLSEAVGLGTPVSKGAGDAEDVAPMAWRTVFDAMLRFAPAQAAFITGDARIVGAVTDIAEIVPPDADIAAQLGVCPATAKALSMARIPAWLLLGHSRVPESRPWLDREVRLLFCSRVQGVAELVPGE